MLNIVNCHSKRKQQQINTFSRRKEVKGNTIGYRNLFISKSTALKSRLDFGLECSLTELLGVCFEGELGLIFQSPYHTLNRWRKKIAERREISHPILCSFPFISEISAYIHPLLLVESNGTNRKYSLLLCIWDV